MKANDDGLVEIEDQVRAIVSFGDEHSLIALSKRKREFLSSLISCGNLNLACKAAGIKRTTAANWLRNPKFKAYMEERMDKAAKANGFYFSRWFSRLVDAYEGRIKMDSVAFKAGELIGRVLRYSGGSDARSDADSAVEITYRFEQKGGVLSPAFSSQFPGPGGGLGLSSPGLDGRAAMGKDGVPNLAADQLNQEAP